MKITFLRSVAVKAEHCEQGTTAEVDDAIAIDLIRAGDARRAGQKETAEAKPAVVEHIGESLVETAEAKPAPAKKK
jgi:hypothetical protein